jgi:hypothetical protein
MGRLIIKNAGKHILTIAFIVLAVKGSFSQDIHFSQFFEAPLLRNPSLAGIFTGDIRVQGVYRTNGTALQMHTGQAPSTWNTKCPLARAMTL